MKTFPSHSRPRRRSGTFLIECLVYLAVFAIVLNVGLVAFYIFWDNSAALHSTSNDISRALQVGEQWRADIRTATGKIETQITPDGALLKIPAGRDEIVYRFSGDTVYRQAVAGRPWTPVLSRVKASQMANEDRGGIKAWHWDLELIPHHTKARTKPLFTFEAVAPGRP